MKMSVIITVSGNNIDRYVNLVELLSCLKVQTFQPHEIILVEQSLDGEFYYNQLPVIDVKYISIFYNIFNLSWCRNVGIYNSSGDYILVMDADALFANNYLLGLSELIVENYYLAWNKYYGINQVEKLQYLVDRKLPTNHRNYIPARFDTSAGFIHLFNKEWFLENVVGYSEDMFEWGKEDNDMMTRCLTITGQENIYNCLVYHLYHRTKQRERIENYDIFVRNIEDPTLTATLMKNKGVGKLESPTLIYGDINYYSSFL
jgi:glycosyltransferase involved in cell wall biosynthesis